MVSWNIFTDAYFNSSKTNASSYACRLQVQWLCDRWRHMTQKVENYWLAVVVNNVNQTAFNTTAIPEVVQIRLCSEEHTHTRILPSGTVYADVFNVSLCLLQRNVYVIHLPSCTNWNTADSEALSHGQSAVKVQSSVVQFLICLIVMKWNVMVWWTAVCCLFTLLQFVHIIRQECAMHFALRYVPCSIVMLVN